MSYYYLLLSFRATCLFDPPTLPPNKQLLFVSLVLQIHRAFPNHLTIPQVDPTFLPTKTLSHMYPLRNVNLPSDLVYEIYNLQTMNSV